MLRLYIIIITLILIANTPCILLTISSIDIIHIISSKDLNQNRWNHLLIFLSQYVTYFLRNNTIFIDEKTLSKFQTLRPYCQYKFHLNKRIKLFLMNKLFNTSNNLLFEQFCF